MVSPLFFSQLVLLALLWLCIMLHYAWPSDRAAQCQSPSQPASPPHKRSREPKPFAGGRSLQLGEGWHSSRHTVHFWNPLVLFQKERYARCYAFTIAYATMIQLCNVF